ncbi:MAG: TolC family outer membrane protein [Proteobacteria bacterium]|nr:TolC family outer membrane protein [Pseudomonadota bacterium]
MRLLLPALLLIAPAARADTDLAKAFREALAHDSRYLSERASAEADSKEVPKAVAALLPQVGFSGSASRNVTKATQKDFRGIEFETRTYYNSENYNLTVKQPLFHRASYAQLMQAMALKARGRELMREEAQNLSVRVAGAYLEALLAAVQVQMETARKAAFEKTLEMTERAFKGGADTLTDIYEIQARRDLAGASQIEAESFLADAMITLQTLMGAPPGEIVPVNDPSLPVDQPQEAVEPWVARAQEQNAALRVLKYEHESARQESKKAFASHYPTLDLVAVHRRASNELDTVLDRGTRTSLVGLQMSVPIFSSGFTWFTTQQAEAREEKARLRYEAGKREVELAVRKEFGNLRLNASKIKALRQAMVSVEQALRGTEKGVVAGTRTTIDVLNAQDQIFRTKVELAKAGGLFVMAHLRLQQAAGASEEQAVLTANAWLKPSGEK